MHFDLLFDFPRAQVTQNTVKYAFLSKKEDWTKNSDN